MELDKDNLKIGTVPKLTENARDIKSTDFSSTSYQQVTPHEKFELDGWRWTSGKNRWTRNQKSLTCELCGFEPRTKNKYREKQDHLVEKHFKDEIDKIIPFCSPYVCPAEGNSLRGIDSAHKTAILNHFVLCVTEKRTLENKFKFPIFLRFCCQCPLMNYLGSKLGCDYNGKDKQGISRHYTGKHGILEKLLQEALAANAISKDKNIQTQIIHDSMNPPHHHIEIIAIKDMLPKSPVPDMQDRTLHKENLEIGNKQKKIQNDPLHKNCKNCQKCTSSATFNRLTDPFVLSLDDPLCIEIKEEYFKDFEAQKVHEQVNIIEFITSEDKNHIHNDSSLVLEQGNKAQKFLKASGKEDFADSAKNFNSSNTATNIDHPSNLENISNIKCIATKASNKHHDSIHQITEIIYPLPYGWKKHCRKRRNNASKDWNVYVISPDGKLFRSCIEIDEYLSENPKVKCDKTVANTDQPSNLEDIKYVATKTSIQASDNSEKITEFNSIVVKEEQESVKAENVISFEDPIVQSVKTETQESDNSEKVKNVDSIIVNKNEKTDGNLSVKSSSKIDHDCPAKFGEICKLCATKFAQKYDMN